MKTAIVPIITNKSGNSSDELNFMYRPIALVTACSEIFEYCFFENAGTISKLQIWNRNTCMALQFTIM